MVYEWPYIISFFLSFLGIIFLFLRRLPDAVNPPTVDTPVSDQNFNVVISDTEVPSEFNSKIRYWLHRIWVYILEAKNVKGGNQAGFKLKKIFRRQGATDFPIIPPFKPKRVDPNSEESLLAEIKTDPKNLDNYKLLGNLYLEKENYSEALDVYNYLVRHIPGDASCYGKVAYCMYHLKDYEKAIVNYEKSLSLDNSQPGRFYSLGLCYELSGNLNQAIKNITRAVEIDTTNEKYKQMLRRLKSKKINS